MRLYFIIAIGVLWCACSPSISKTIIGKHPPLEKDARVEVIGPFDPLPEEVKLLGTLKIGDTGFTANCSYETVIRLATEQARTAGGNLLKLTKHKTPSVFGSSCHRIDAQILYVPDLSNFRPVELSVSKIDSTLFNEGCAAVHFYRYSGAGAIVGYDIYVDKELICRISNNSKESVKLKAAGPVIFWARTESKAELEIDLQPGRHYYVRCGISVGVVIGRPRMELVENNNGAYEYDRIRRK